MSQNYLRQTGFKVLGIAVALFAFTALGTVPVFASVERVGEVVNSGLDQFENFLDYTQINRLKAESEEKLGITLAPYFKARMNYTDNVFTQPDTDRDDVTWTFRPGISGTYVNEKIGSIGVSYEAAFNYFTKHGDQNEQDQFFHAFAELHPMENLTIDVNETFSQQGATAARAGLKVINYRDNSVGVDVEYDWNEWTPSIGYENFDREYNGKTFDRIDYSEDKWFWKLSRDVTEELGGRRSRVAIGLDQGFINYENTANRASKWWEIYTKLDAELPMNMDLSARVGLHRRMPNAQFRNNFTPVVADILLGKDLNNGRSRVSGGFRRQPVESTFDDQLFYDEKLWYLKGVHKLTPRLRGRASLNLRNADWEGVGAVGGVAVKRDDWSIGTSVGMDYAVREWLILHVDYDWNRRDSKISDFDYGRNDFSVGMTMPL